MADTAVFLDKGETASVERVARARTATRPWRVKTSDGGDLFQALQRAGFAPADITVDRNELLVPVATESAAADLLATLVADGVRISTFAPAVGDLEHAFLDLNRPDTDPTSTPGASE